MPVDRLWDSLSRQSLCCAVPGTTRRKQAEPSADETVAWLRQEAHRRRLTESKLGFRRFDWRRFWFPRSLRRHCRLHDRSGKPHRSVPPLPHNRRCNTLTRPSACNRTVHSHISSFLPLPSLLGPPGIPFASSGHGGFDAGPSLEDGKPEFLCECGGEILS
jgi:hypothetical protein